MSFSAPCQLCTKKFKTGVSLKKHFGLKHQERNLEIAQFLDESNSPCEQPKAAALIDEEMEDYLKWLGVLVERINGSLVPDHPGKWCHVDCLQVPQKYFAHLLCRLGNPMVDSVRDAPHIRQPIFKRIARRFSYKIFNEETLKLVLEEQDLLQFRPKALFRNSDEVPDISEMSAEEALAYAKARARKQDSRPTSRSYLDIGPGEGRCTRELELIWWPSLYSRCSEYGKLTFRFFVRKTSL
ncbi:hypothetical protein pdam_00025693 [Pocillopora damicornis]|uniref:C2H2-type domain-containing protein n=1 Tax=Pocillopora damicornis TaxID=46731 RepID=A0A3M6T5V1_POCDA|nr:uncharacterized protein LOC113682247 [Pocillopora damicornis]RMX36689.1 hypothetical protein pdam_00025693 [Pocillopora damicornis]